MNRLGNGTIEVKKKDLHLCTYVPSKTKLKKKEKKSFEQFLSYLIAERLILFTFTGKSRIFPITAD